MFAVLSSGLNLSSPRYVGKTREELDEEFVFQIVELGQLSMLGMLASTEAALRVDYIERVANKKKDNVSRRFRKRYKERGVEKIRLEEDILDTWKEHGSGSQIKTAVGEFKSVLKLRHWLAHGRYWKPKLGRAEGYTPLDVFDICKLLLQAVDLMADDAPGP